MLMGNGPWYFLPDVWFQKENLTSKRKSLEDFIKRAIDKIKLLENKEHGNILMSEKLRYLLTH